MRAMFQLKQPILDGTIFKSHIVGTFESDDTNTWADTAFGTFLMRNDDILYVLIFNDECDIRESTDTILVIN